ncbi:MAG: cytochrome c oxidase subunit II [Bacteroidetes bacterium]|nr:cytochrome c oxidase subunit II [Bacteroidota bacterium]
MRPNIIAQTDETMMFIIGCSIILLLLVTVSMVYFCFRYSRKKNPVAENIHGNTTLEITWTVLPTILVMVMFFYGYNGYKNLRDIPADAYVIKVTGQMWKWTFEYPETKKKSDTLFVPVGKNIKMEIQSNDVNHSFYIPSQRVKEDAIPGKTNRLWFNPEHEGRYDIACAEYCGMNHSYMYAVLMVIPVDKFEKWVKELPVPDTTKKTTDSLKTGGMKDSLKTTSTPVDTTKKGTDTTKKDMKTPPDAIKKDSVKK